MNNDWIITGVDMVKVALVLALVSLLSFASSCSPPQSAIDADARQWVSGPGGTRYIDMGDGTRCYQYTANTFSCLRVNPSS